MGIPLQQQDKIAVLYVPPDLLAVVRTIWGN